MKKKNKTKTQALFCLCLSLELVGFMVIGAFLGQALDSFIGGGYKGLGLLLVEGLLFVIWLRHVIKVVHIFGKENKSH